MKKYLRRRVIFLFFSIVGISVIIFYLINLQPGNPYTGMINPNLSPEEINFKLEKLGYYDPIYIKYIKWFKQVLLLDFGYSINYSRPVINVIGDRLINTLLLSGVSLMCTLFFSIFIGFLAAIKKNSFFDFIVSILTTTSISIPTFFLALIAIKIFSFNLNILPSSGLVDVRANSSGFLYYIDVIKHLILPVLVLTIVQLGAFIKYVREGFIEIMTSDYILYARAKGLTKHKAIFSHGIKNIINIVITIFCLQIPTLFSGALITETVFVWPGIGRLAYDAVQNRDYPLIMGILFISSIIILISNLIADIFYKLIDKRVNY